MTENERIIRTFAAQFSPALQVVKTERINNVRIADAWQCSYWNQTNSIGITAVAHSGGLHAYLESAGPGAIAENAGQVMATALGMFDPNPPKAA